MRRPISLLLPLLLAVPCLVQAQGALDTRLRDQLRQTILELRQLQDENAQLKAKANSAPAAPAADPDTTQRLKRALAEAGRLGNQEAERARELDDARKQIAELTRRLDSATADGRTAQAREQRLNADLAAVRSTVSTCESHNGQLADLGRELLERYHDRGFTDVLLDREPLLGVHRVRFETLVQTYEGRLREQRLPPAASPTSAASEPPTP